VLFCCPFVNFLETTCIIIFKLFLEQDLIVEV